MASPAARLRAGPAMSELDAAMGELSLEASRRFSLFGVSRVTKGVLRGMPAEQIDWLFPALVEDPGRLGQLIKVLSHEGSYPKLHAVVLRALSWDRQVDGETHPFVHQVGQQLGKMPEQMACRLLGAILAPHNATDVQVQIVFQEVSASSLAAIVACEAGRYRPAGEALELLAERRVTLHRQARDKSQVARLMREFQRDTAQGQKAQRAIASLSLTGAQLTWIEGYKQQLEEHYVQRNYKAQRLLREWQKQLHATKACLNRMASCSLVRERREALAELARRWGPLWWPAEPSQDFSSEGSSGGQRDRFDDDLEILAFTAALPWNDYVAIEKLVDDTEEDFRRLVVEVRQRVTQELQQRIAQCRAMMGHLLRTGRQLRDSWQGGVGSHQRRFESLVQTIEGLEGRLENPQLFRRQLERRESEDPAQQLERLAALREELLGQRQRLVGAESWLAALIQRTTELAGSAAVCRDSWMYQKRLGSVAGGFLTRCSGDVVAKAESVKALRDTYQSGCLVDEAGDNLRQQQTIERRRRTIFQEMERAIAVTEQKIAAVKQELGIEQDTPLNIEVRVYAILGPQAQQVLTQPPFNFPPTDVDLGRLYNEGIRLRHLKDIRTSEQLQQFYQARAWQQ